MDQRILYIYMCACKNEKIRIKRRKKNKKGWICTNFIYISHVRRNNVQDNKMLGGNAYRQIGRFSLSRIRCIRISSRTKTDTRGANFW